MDPFIKTFYSVDRQHNEQITIDELRSYVDQNNLDPVMIEKWKALFDRENTGVITLSKFCDVLGLRNREAGLQLAKAQLVAAPRDQDADIETVFQQMPLEMRRQIAAKVKQLTGNSSNFKTLDVIQELKKWLDQTYGRAWHVVINRGPCWTAYSYTEDMSYHFILSDIAYQIWCTVDESY